MPTLDINGTQVSVDDSFLKLSHDEQNATVNEIASSMNAPKSQGSSLGGVAKSLAYGIPKGVVGLASLPGDAMELAGYPNNMHASMQKAVEGLTGKFYEPQGTAENIASKVGEFLPAVVGGPETLAMKLATRVAAPAVGSEIGEQVGGPVGGVAGALVGAAGATAAARKFQEMAAARSAAPALTADKVLETGGKQFDAARDMNVVVKPDFATNAAADIRDAIKSYDPQAVSAVHGAADRLEDLAGSGKGIPPVAVNMNDTENIRKQLVSLKTDLNPSVRSAAKEALQSLQKSQMALTAADTLSGDAAAYRNLVSDAVGNWAKGKQAQTVMGKIDLGNLNAETAGSGANVDNALRQSIKQLARPVSNTNLPVWKKLGFSNEGGALINQAATGTKIGNAARYLGKYAPTGIVSAAGGIGMGHMIGGPAGAAIPAVGYIAKKIGDLSTKKAVNAITSLVLSESPLASHVAAQLPPQIVKQMPPKAQLVLQKLILARPAMPQATNQLGQPVGQSNTY